MAALAIDRGSYRWRCLGVVVSLLLALTSFDAGAEEAAEAENADVRYVELKPTFITNFGPSTTPRLKYIKTDVALRVLGSEGETAAEMHLPALRHALIMLLSRQSDEQIATGNARESVREAAKTELNAILSAESGEAYIRDLLFTNFIVQR